MSAIPLTYSGASYFDSTRALERGDVSPQGISLTYVPIEDTSALFRQVAQDAGCDASEMSLSTYMLLRGRGDERLVGLPVFPSRAFRHRHVYIHTGCEVSQPVDLRGKNVGIPHYQMTAALWVRGFLQHDFGIHPSEISWWEGGLTEPTYTERLDYATPEGVTVNRIPPGRTLETMLETGELDGLVTTSAPQHLAAGTTISRLFPDYRDTEMDYYRRTGIIPIMHLVVLRTSIYRKMPWIALALLEAFEESRLDARRRVAAANVLPLTHPWMGNETELLQQFFGGDPFVYGVSPNRHVLEAAARLSYEQGLSDRQLELGELFAEETLAWRSTASAV